MKAINLLWICLWVLMSAACMQPTQSSDVKTEDLTATFSVTHFATLSTVSCFASFTKTATGESVTLSADDIVTCNGEAMTQSGANFTSAPEYVAGGEYTIRLIRRGASPYGATVTMPTGATPLSPAPGGSITKGQPVTVIWSPSTNYFDLMTVTIYNQQSGNSVVYSVNTDDNPEDGSVTFTASETQSVPPVAGNWNGVMYMNRVRSGEMPSGLNGTITAANMTYHTLWFFD